jgi:L-lactate transport
MHEPGILTIIAAFIPLVWLFVSLWKLKMPAHKAGMAAFILTLGLAFVLFNAKPKMVAQATLEGIMLSLFPIIWVIFSALFVYNITVKSGSMNLIKGILSGISPDRRIQALILAFSFGGFLEAVAGFGTAVAIPAGILVAMGFEPILAASVCLIANTIPVAFGVIGVPIITLAQVTGLPLDRLSLFTSLQLIPFIILLPLVIVHLVTGGISNIKGVLGVSILSASAFALAQTLMALYIGPETAAVAGSLLSLAVTIVWIRIFPVKKIWLFKNDKTTVNDHHSDFGVRKALIALSPYIIMLVCIILTRFVPAFRFLKEYPFTLHKQFYYGPGGKAMTFDLFTSAGTLFFIAAIIGGFLQKLCIKDMASMLGKTLKQIWKTAMTVVSVVALAKLMGYTGMVDNISKTIALASGSFYPLLAPALGALGTFLTGSDTSSNVLFGNLQKQTATRLGMNTDWLVSSNASGATAGKMISPQSISIATSATGLSGREGTLLGITMKYCILYTIFLGLLVFVFEKLF